MLTIVGLNEADLIAGARAFLADRGAQPSDTAAPTGEARQAKLIEMGQACLDWATDTGECHFCSYLNDGSREAPRRHGDDCPVREYEELPNAAAPPVGHAPVAEVARGSLTLEEHLSLMRTREREALAERDTKLAAMTDDRDGWRAMAEAPCMACAEKVAERDAMFARWLGDARSIVAAAVALKDSLGEYVRQSMYFNPEWRGGLAALDAALETPLAKECRRALAAEAADRRNADLAALDGAAGKEATTVDCGERCRIEWDDGLKCEHGFDSPTGPGAT